METLETWETFGLSVIFTRNMSFDCVTLSSDSSRPSSPCFNDFSYEEDGCVQHKFELTERCQNQKAIESDRSSKNFYSLSDSESDFDPRISLSAPNSLDTLADDNLDYLNTGKRKGTRNLVFKEGKRKKIEKQQDKETLQAAKEYQRSLKPGECIKYVTAVIDKSLIQFSCLRDVEKKLSERELNFSTRSNTIQGTVFWNRKLIGTPGENENSLVKEEEHVLLCLDHAATFKLLSEGMLVSNVSFVKETIPGKFLTLVLCGSGNYLSGSSKESKKKPKINFRKSMEESLVKMQMMLGVGYRTVEDSSEFASLMAMFTKAVAETPFKREKQKWERNGILSWFAQGDSKDCVRVTSSGHGCLLLWQQQLRQFNNVGLDVSKAVASSYPSPQALLEVSANLLKLF
ncbi:hypothetical protein J437_LFUL003194 [Ladona fulva]|uniref:Uncharacterized protein n=1 Tax=Ladona fulva TaxID=123851 RepID=A0A8K0JY68_LADFU|nr:hypothetical protein J437_LFUL003194 [Ladona fulva]